MSAIYLLVCASISVAGGFLIAFLISAKNGQFDDQQGSAMRMLHSDEPLTADPNSGS